MNIEIERKFLVQGDYKSLANKKYDIKQGYISTDPERTVRIRIRDKKAFITIKGLSNGSGMSRMEWEKEIPYEDGISLLKLCHSPIIEKVRYLVKQGEHIIEVDEFFGENKGLVLAEIELNNENEKLELPSFLGNEVTGNMNYYNSYLSEHPYINWK